MDSERARRRFLAQWISTVFENSYPHKENTATQAEYAAPHPMLFREERQRF